MGRGRAPGLITFLIQLQRRTGYYLHFPSTKKQRRRNGELQALRGQESTPPFAGRKDDVPGEVARDLPGGLHALLSGQKRRKKKGGKRTPRPEVSQETS